MSAIARTIVDVRARFPADNNAPGPSFEHRMRVRSVERGPYTFTESSEDEDILAHFEAGTLDELWSVVEEHLVRNEIDVHPSLIRGVFEAAGLDEAPWFTTKVRAAKRLECRKGGSR